MKNRFLIFAFLMLSLSKGYAQSDALTKHIDAGVALFDEGRYEAAIEEYKKALKIDDASLPANYEIASAYLQLKDFDKAITYADKVIAAGEEFTELASVIKGSALDMSGNTEEAIKTYRKAITKYPENYLLHYNLALTLYNKKELIQAEDALIQALENKPSHASSHLLLAYTMQAQHERVKSLLALYNFLLLEPKGERAQSALELLNAQFGQGVSHKDEKTIDITIPSYGKSDDFRAAEMMIALLEAGKTLEKNQDKSEYELFYENTQSFFNILGELKKDHKSFWWTFYVDFFYSMAGSKHVETFSYYISQSKNKKEIDNWLQMNEPKINQLSNWYAGFARKF